MWDATGGATYWQKKQTARLSAMEAFREYLESIGEAGIAEASPDYSGYDFGAEERAYYAKRA